MRRTQGQIDRAEMKWVATIAGPFTAYVVNWRRWTRFVANGWVVPTGAYRDREPLFVPSDARGWEC